MKSGLFTLICVLLLVLANFLRDCFASSKEAYFGKEGLAILSNATVPIEDSYFYSVWGQCQFELTKIQNPPPKNLYDDLILTIKSNRYKSGEMPLRLAKLKNKQTAPLMIYYPGAFSSAYDSSSDQWINQYTKLGFNVLVFPNPWSSDYIKQNPYFYLGDFIEEGFAHYELFKSAVASIATISTGEIHLSGVSYGAFLSAITYALDTESKKPLINSKVTLISPPFYFKQTLARFDKLLYAFKNDYEDYNLGTLISKIVPICVQTSDLLPPEYIIESAKGVTAYAGFHQYLVDSAILQDKLKALNQIPDRDLGEHSPRFNEWKNHLTFRSFIHQNIPVVIDYFDTQLATLSYWTDLLLKKDKKFRILTSNDDFINEENVWDESLPYLFRLDHGGHFGFRNEKWFYAFMRTL